MTWPSNMISRDICPRNHRETRKQTPRGEEKQRTRTKRTRETARNRKTVAYALKIHGALMFCAESEC